MLTIFVINLDGSTERLKKVGSELAKYALAFERISAVDGRLMSLAQLQQHYCPQKNASNYYKALTAGEIGCYLSHRKVWQTIIERELTSAVILEDDFLLSQSIDDIVSFAQSGTLYDYIKLSDHPGRSRKTRTLKTIGQSQLVSFDKIPARTCAQLVSAQGAKKLLQHSETFGRPVDIDLQYWWEKDIEVLGLKPFAFMPAPDVKSDISAIQNRSSVKTHRLRRIHQQLSFKLNNVLRRR